MKFDYAIGNPPYQITKDTTQVNIWPDFIKESTKISSKTCMIHPGRWVIPKPNDKKLQKELVNDFNLQAIDYYPSADSCFSNIGLDGGVSITYFNKNYNNKPLLYIENNIYGEYSIEQIIFTTPFFKEAYEKVFKDIDTSNNMLKYKYGYSGFNNGPGVDKKINGNKLSADKSSLKQPVSVWINTTIKNSSGNFEWYYIEKTDLLDIPDWLFKSRKVMITNHGHSCAATKGNVFNNNPQICEKYSTGVGLFWFYPAHDTDRELELIKSLFMTKTARYLMCILQRERLCMGFECIPDYLELAKLLPEDELFTDEWFYKTFDFSEGLINEIETRVSPKVDKEV